MIKRLIDILTGGLGGTVGGTIAGLVQLTALLGALGAAWLWIWENKDAIFIVVRVGDLVFLAAMLGVVVAVIWLAGRTRPRE